MDRPNPQQALVRLLNSTRDFAAAVCFIKRAGHHGPATIEHVALLLGALVSYSRAFKEQDGYTLGQIPVFLALAADLGADLELHATIVGLSIQPIAGSEPLCAPVQRAATVSNCKVHSVCLPNRLRTKLARQLDLGAFERISNLMRVACVFTLAEIGDPRRRHKTVTCRG